MKFEKHCSKPPSFHDQPWHPFCVRFSEVLERCPFPMHITFLDTGGQSYINKAEHMGGGQKSQEFRAQRQYNSHLLQPRKQSRWAFEQTRSSSQRHCAWKCLSSPGTWYKKMGTACGRCQQLQLATEQSQAWSRRALNLSRTKHC